MDIAKTYRTPVEAYIELYAYLKNYSGTLTEQIVLAYLNGRRKYDHPGAELQLISPEHVVNLATMCGVDKRALYRAFKSLATAGMIEHKSTQAGLYARICDTVPTPEAIEKDLFGADSEKHLQFARLFFRRSAPVKPELDPEADSETVAKYHKKALPAWRKRCLEYSLTGLPYVLYSIVMAVYAVKTKKGGHTFYNSVTGTAGFQLWLAVSKPHTINKALKELQAIAGHEHLSLLFRAASTGRTGHTLYDYTPQPESYFSESGNYVAKYGADLAALDTLCERLTAARVEAAQACKRVRPDNLAYLKDWDAYLAYGLKKYNKLTEEQQAAPDLFTDPEKYGIPALSMRALLTPGADCAAPIINAGVSEDCTMNEQFKLSKSRTLTGHQLKTWETGAKDVWCDHWCSWFAKYEPIAEAERAERERKEQEAKRAELQDEYGWRIAPALKSVKQWFESDRLTREEIMDRLSYHSDAWTLAVLAPDEITEGGKCTALYQLKKDDLWEAFSAFHPAEAAMLETYYNNMTPEEREHLDDRIFEERKPIIKDIQRDAVGKAIVTAIAKVDKSFIAGCRAAAGGDEDTMTPGQKKRLAELAAKYGDAVLDRLRTLCDKEGVPYLLTDTAYVAAYRYLETPYDAKNRVQDRETRAAAALYKRLTAAA